MKTWSTEILAISPTTGILTKYGGPNIKAPSKELAHDYCQNSGIGYGYCHVGDQLVMEIPCKPNSYDPDFTNAIDYELEDEN